MGRQQRAKVSGSPGQHARLKGLFAAAWPLFFAMLAAGYLARAALPEPYIAPSIAGLLFLVLAVVLAAFLNSAETKLLSFFKGAKGEEDVARELAFLPHDYRVFNCIEFGNAALLPASGDYDHVVIGPAGIFVVETKNWSGTVTLEEGKILYNGNLPDRPPIDQVRAAAASLRNRLSEACGEKIEVKPVICFSANTLKSGTAGYQGVVACNLRELNSIVTDTSGGRVSSSIQAKAAAYLNGLV